MKSRARLSFVVAAFACLALDMVTCTQPFQCLNEQGELVDHWTIIKAPRSFQYLYSDNNTIPFALSPFQLNATVGALGATVTQIFNQGMNYLVYNDEPPTAFRASFVESLLGAVETPGHNKGILAFDDAMNHGFWITHSIPEYPDNPSLPYSGIRSEEEIYAQSMFCLSLEMNEIEDLAGLLRLNYPGIYAQNISASAQAQFQNISLLSHKSMLEMPICINASVHGMNIFAKSGQWGKDLWDSCIAPTYESGFLAETWMRGGECGPACPPAFNYTTLDVKAVDYGYPTFAWTEGDEHGKWGVATDLPVVCFGDINRMTSQSERGGGALCFENYDLWLQFTNAIMLTNNCSSTFAEEYEYGVFRID